MATGEPHSEEVTLYEELSPVQKAIVDALKMGNTRTASYQYAGIAKDTFYRWLKENRTFSDAVTHAEAVAEVGHVGVLAHAAIGGDWRASLEWLKRRRRVDWGDSIDVRKLDDDTLLRLLSLAEGSAAQGIETEPGRVPAGNGEDA